MGNLFYFIFHSGFVGAEHALHVPLHMMDRACKNRHGRYNPAGEATLRFETMADEPPGSAPESPNATPTAAAGPAAGGLGGAGGASGGGGSGTSISPASANGTAGSDDVPLPAGRV